MQIQIVPRKKGELNLPLIYLIITLIMAGAAYGLFRLHAVPNIPCPFKTMTSYPCPTCGSTRLVLSLFHVHLLRAFLWNPGLFMLGIVAVFWFGYGGVSQFTGKKFQITLTKRECFRLKLVLLVLFVLNWAYLVIAGV